MEFRLSDVPNWLLGIGVGAFGLAALYIFVLPGKGIEWAGAYYGPYRLSDSIEKLRAFANEIDSVERNKLGWVCIKYKGIANQYCHEANGQFSSSGSQGHWGLHD